jgi:hypothetical protein
MRIGTFGIAAGILALGLAAWLTTPAIAQGPLWDVVTVNMPYSVTIGDKVLQPGEYRIEQMHDTGGGSRVLLIYGDNGMKFETSAMTIPCLDINTARDTKVVLHHFGNDYYFDKIWIQGKDYGYEFPLPNSVKAREKEAMAPVTVAANYSTKPAETTTTQQQETTVAQATTPAPVTPPPSAERAETPAPAPEAPPPPREMPKTSAGWLMMLLSGGGLSSAGLLLRRKR